MFQTLRHDIRYAVRLIARNPWSSATVVATLTVGIALNVSVFSVLNGLLLRPWVRSQPETFLSISPRFTGEYQLWFSEGGMSQPDYALYRDASRTVESLAAYRFLSLTLSGDVSGTIRGALISCNLFDVVRPGPPILGRYLAADECAPGRHQMVAVLSETAWRAAFDADPQVIGRTIQLNRLPFTVVGVAPTFTPGSGDPDSDRDVWIPYSLLDALQPTDPFFGSPRAEWLVVIGRRRPGASLSQVQQELSALARAADERVPGRTTSLRVTDGSLVQGGFGGRAPLLFSLTLGTTTVLLLLACVNVTTLLLSRAASRQREMATRISLGAGRLRLLRQLLTESLLLSGMAAVASVLIAQYAPSALWHSVMSRPAPFDLTPDWRVLAYSVALGLAAGVIAGLSPALEALRPRASDALKAASGAITPGPRRSVVRGVLVAVQVALSLVMLVQAGLIAQAQQRFLAHDPGFETRQVIGVMLSSVRGGYQPPAAFYQELEARARAIPGCATPAIRRSRRGPDATPSPVAAIDGIPLPKPRGFGGGPARRQVSADFFATLDVRLVRGRFFTSTDRPGPPATPTVISEAMADRYWPGQDPVGRTFQTERPPRGDRRQPESPERALHAGRRAVLPCVDRPGASASRSRS